MADKRSFLRALRKWIVFYACIALGWCVRLLPVRWVQYIGKKIGALAYAVLARVRRDACAHVSLAYGDELSADECRDITRRLFENLGMNIAEVLYFPRITADNFEKLVTVQGKEHLDAVLAEGKAAIILSAHFGNWELLAASLSFMRYPLSVIARAVRDERFNRYITAVRRSKGVDVIIRGDSTRQSLKVLKKKQLLGIMPDVDIDTAGGIFVDFFGRPAWTPSGPARLALRTGTPMVPCFIVRQGYSHQLIIGDPIYPEHNAVDEDAVYRLTVQWSAVVERVIRQYPEQWIWMHERWKRQPVKT